MACTGAGAVGLQRTDREERAGEDEHEGQPRRARAAARPLAGGTRGGDPGVVGVDRLAQDLVEQVHARVDGARPEPSGWRSRGPLGGTFGEDVGVDAERPRARRPTSRSGRPARAPAPCAGPGPRSAPPTRRPRARPGRRAGTAGPAGSSAPPSRSANGGRSEATTGTPEAIASSTTMPKLSRAVCGATNTSAPTAAAPACRPRRPGRGCGSPAAAPGARDRRRAPRGRGGRGAARAGRRAGRPGPCAARRRARGTAAAAARSGSPGRPVRGVERRVVRRDVEAVRDDDGVAAEVADDHVARGRRDGDAGVDPVDGARQGRPGEPQRARARRRRVERRDHRRAGRAERVQRRARGERLVHVQQVDGLGARPSAGLRAAASGPKATGATEPL